MTNPKILTWSFDTFAEKEANYITLFVESDYVAGDVQLLEPEKCETWQWFTKNDLPKPLFPPIVALKEFGFISV